MFPSARAEQPFGFFVNQQFLTLNATSTLNYSVTYLRLLVNTSVVHFGITFQVKSVS